MKHNIKDKQKIKKIYILSIFISILMFFSLAFAETNYTIIAIQNIDIDLNVQLPELNGENWQINSEIDLFSNTVDRYFINQIGANTAHIIQRGDINSAIQNQNGNGHIALIYQEGYNNSVIQNQRGSYNYAYAVQKGDNNRAIQEQYSVNNLAIIIQYGSNNVAEQYQGKYGGSNYKSIIIQQGNGNFAKVIQN